MACNQVPLPDYFKDPNNTAVFGQMGMKCVAGNPDQYGVGAMVMFVKGPDGKYTIKTMTQIQVVAECGDEFYATLCDPLKPASQGPCSNLRVGHFGK